VSFYHRLQFMWYTSDTTSTCTDIFFKCDTNTFNSNFFGLSCCTARTDNSPAAPRRSNSYRHASLTNWMQGTNYSFSEYKFTHATQYYKYHFSWPKLWPVQVAQSKQTSVQPLAYNQSGLMSGLANHTAPIMSSAIMHTVSISATDCVKLERVSSGG